MVNSTARVQEISSWSFRSHHCFGFMDVKLKALTNILNGLIKTLLHQDAINVDAEGNDNGDDEGNRYRVC
jgi:hypothetical protein